MESSLNPYRADYDFTPEDMKAVFAFAKEQKWSPGKLRHVARAVELVVARMPATGELDFSQVKTAETSKNKHTSVSI